MGQKRKKGLRPDTPQRAARLAREAERHKRRQGLWITWSFFLACLAATTIAANEGYRQHGHLHLHGGLVVCDVVMLALVVAATRLKSK